MTPVGWCETTWVGVTDGLIYFEWVGDCQFALLESEILCSDVFEMFDVRACLLFRPYFRLSVWSVVINCTFSVGTNHDFSVEAMLKWE